MKKLLKFTMALSCIAFIISSCGKGQSGQLVGIADRPTWNGINPYGMVYIPSASINIRSI